MLRLSGGGLPGQNRCHYTNRIKGLFLCLGRCGIDNALGQLLRNLFDQLIKGPEAAFLVDGSDDLRLGVEAEGIAVDEKVAAVDIGCFLGAQVDYQGRDVLWLG